MSQDVSVWQMTIYTLLLVPFAALTAMPPMMGMAYATGYLEDRCRMPAFVGLLLGLVAIALYLPWWLWLAQLYATHVLTPLSGIQ